MLNILLVLAASLTFAYSQSLPTNSTEESIIDWSDPAMQEWNQTAESGDWVGAIVNNPCGEICNQTDCTEGQWCIISECYEPCSQTTWCTMEYMLDDWSWEQHNCTDGDFEVAQNCTAVCEFEDCSDDKQGQICWQEMCDDGCGAHNCTMWLSHDDEWFGEECQSGTWLPQGWRLQDPFSAVRQFAQGYVDTFELIADNFCPPDEPECKEGAQDGIDALMGEGKPREKVDANLTQNWTMEANNAIKMGMMQGEMFAASQSNRTEMVTNFTDMALQNPVLKEIGANFINDTAGLVMEDAENSTALMRAGRLWEYSNSTEQSLGMLAENVWAPQAEAYVESQTQPEAFGLVKEMFSVFMTGVENSGLFKKGARDGQ